MKNKVLAKNRVFLDIKLNDKLKHKRTEEVGTLIDIKITPNGINDRKIILVLTVEFQGERTIIATSDRFEVVEEEYYLQY